MVIEKILKELTPERIKLENEEVNAVQLPPALTRWAKEYSEVGEGLRTNEYFWKWIYRTTRTITLPFVKKDFFDSLLEVKTLLIMFVVLLDDTFDRSKNRKLGQELLKIPSQKRFINNKTLSSSEKKYFDFSKKVWDYLLKEIQLYPRYDEFKDILKYDVKQLLNEMDYALLVNENLFLINKTEFYYYFSHNMQAVIDVTLDLMCYPEFDSKALGGIREIAIEAQKMARIGNWVSTWEREVEEGDFTSGVFAEAIEEGVLIVSDLRKENALEIIKKIKDAEVEGALLNEWESSYCMIEKRGREINQAHLIGLFLKSLEKLIVFHLSSRGYK